jgi:hypothetical protein
VLAVLAMLAPKWALRVAPGGSAPPIPSAARRVALLSGRDGKAGVSTELESCPGEGQSVISTLRAAGACCGGCRAGLTRLFNVT